VEFCFPDCGGLANAQPFVWRSATLHDSQPMFCPQNLYSKNGKRFRPNYFWARPPDVNQRSDLPRWARTAPENVSLRNKHVDKLENLCLLHSRVVSTQQIPSRTRQQVKRCGVAKQRICCGAQKPAPLCRTATPHLSAINEDNAWRHSGEDEASTAACLQRESRTGRSDFHVGGEFDESGLLTRELQCHKNSVFTSFVVVGFDLLET
jgi:hypothetical protein